MPKRSIKPEALAGTASFWLMVALLAALWIAGGASRPDVLGQPIIRFAAWTLLIGVVLLLPLPPLKRVKPIAAVLALSLLLIVIQLIALPPSVWASLPGRDLFWHAAAAGNEPQVWRPLSVAPESTVNALGSLVVPFVTLVLVAHLGRDEHWRLLKVLLIMIVAGCLLGVLQFSGTKFDNPFINEIEGLVSGNLANRNHFALFVAIGCLIAPAWGFASGRREVWKMLAALALIPFFVLLILATGSRMGMLTGAIGIGLGFFAVRQPVRSELRRLSRPQAIAIIVGILAFLAISVILSITLDRAYSFERSAAGSVTEDPRIEALPVVLGVIGDYFPFGTGFGTFDPIYRIAEPDEVLRPLYFNEAHNDWLQILLEGGIAGVALLLGALVWWGRASLRVWFGPQTKGVLARIGSAAVLLVLLASLVDYPARTPTMMAMLVIFGAWLARAERSDAGGLEKSHPATVRRE